MEELLHELYEEIGRYYAESDLSGLEQYLLRKYREAAPGCSACYSPLAVSVLNEMGSLYRGAGRQPEAINAFRQAAMHVAGHLGKQNAEYATVINNLGGALRLDGQYAEAMECFEEALSLYREIGEEDSYLYASAQNNKALVCIDTGDLDTAIPCLQDGLACVRRMAEKAPEYRSEAGAAYVNLASVLYRKKDLSGALEYCEKALAEYESVPENSRDHLAAVWNLIGNIRLNKNDRPGAKEAYEKALLWTERFFGKNHEYKILEERLRELS